MSIRASEERERFANALNKMLDDAGVKRHARASYINKTLDLGISNKACKKWLDGETFPTLDKLVLIAKHFNFSIDALNPTPNPIK